MENDKAKRVMRKRPAAGFEEDPRFREWLEALVTERDLRAPPGGLQARRPCHTERAPIPKRER
jgi:hypothetical protein